MGGKSEISIPEGEGSIFSGGGGGGIGRLLPVKFIDNKFHDKLHNRFHNTTFASFSSWEPLAFKKRLTTYKRSLWEKDGSGTCIQLVYYKESVFLRVFGRGHENGRG